MTWQDLEPILLALLTAPIWGAVGHLVSRRIAGRASFQRLSLEHTVRLLERHEADNAALRVEVKEARAARERADTELDRMRAELANTIDTLRWDKRDLEQALRTLTVEHEMTEARHDALRAADADCRERLRRSEAERETLRDENRTLKAIMEQGGRPAA